jgi:hypothetical protein
MTMRQEVPQLKGDPGKKVKKPLTRGAFLHPYFSPKLQRSFGLGFGPGRFRHFLEVGLEDILVQAEHQAAALGAQGRVVIQSGHPLVPAPTIDTLIFIKRHNQSPLLAIIYAIIIPYNPIFLFTVNRLILNNNLSSPGGLKFSLFILPDRMGKMDQNYG